MQIKATQPEEMILQQEINVKIAEEKNRTCIICFKQLSRKKDLPRHMRVVHKIKKKTEWLEDWIQEMEVKPETLENATEGCQWVDDWLPEVQNKPEPTPSQMETLAA